jgi:hypothetical protein
MIYKDSTHFVRTFLFQIVKFLKKNCLIVCGIYQALLKDTSGEVCLNYNGIMGSVTVTIIII